MDRFEELTTPHIGALYRMAFYLSGNRDDAEDLVQEAFFKAQKSFHTLKDYTKCKAWLRSILYRYFIDECRRRKRYVDIDIDVADTEETDDFSWPETITPKSLSESLEKLSPKYRLPLVAFFMSGQSYKEIAESLDIPIGTVMSRIHRAKNIMRRELTAAPQPSLRVVNGGRNEL